MGAEAQSVRRIQLSAVIERTGVVVLGVGALGKSFGRIARSSLRMPAAQTGRLSGVHASETRRADSGTWPFGGVVLWLYCMKSKG